MFLKDKFVKAHMKVAELYADLSSARRLHVGCVIVKDNTIIGIGYNGMPSGWDNDCEDMIREEQDGIVKYTTKSKPEVLHAETNAIAKLAKSTESGLGATMFVTHSPCLDCAKLVYQSGINTVYYRNSYRNEDGIQFLEKAGVKIEKI